MQRINYDFHLQAIFNLEQVDPRNWYTEILTPHTWSTRLELLVFSYIMKIDVVSVGNYLNEFMVISHQYVLATLINVPVDNPDNKKIYILYHKHYHPLEKIISGNHFAYLEPVTYQVISMETNSITSNIVRSQSNAKDLEPSHQIINVESRCGSTEPKVFKKRRTLWTKEENLEIYKCYCITHLNKLPIQSEMFKLWRQRNPTVRPTLSIAALYHRKLKVMQLLTTIEKDKILKEADKEILTPKAKENFQNSTDKESISIPLLCESVSRSTPLNQSLQEFSRTEMVTSKHRACVCVICDSFIIGVEKIKWLSDMQLIAKESTLSVNYLEDLQGQELPSSLRN